MMAQVTAIRTNSDKCGTHDDYTLVLAAGRKGRGKELGRVHVWGDSLKSEEQAIEIIAEMGQDYEIIWDE